LCSEHIDLGTLITVADALPSGFSAVSMDGTGWSCDPLQVACTRNDALAAGSSYPPITLVVDIAPDSVFSLPNTPITVTETSVSHQIMQISIGDFCIGTNDSVNTNTAAACIDNLVKMGASDYFDTLDSAYAALTDNISADLYLHKKTYAAVPLVTNTVLSLHGGRVCDFSTANGYTKITGPVEITVGTVIPSRIIIL